MSLSQACSHQGKLSVKRKSPWNRLHKRDLLAYRLKPLGLHVVNVGSIPTGPTHGEASLQSLPGDVLKPTPNVRMSLRSGLNLEGRLSDPQVFCLPKHSMESFVLPWDTRPRVRS